MPPTTSSSQDTPALLERYKYVIFLGITAALLAGIAVLLWQRPTPATITVSAPEPTAIPSATPIPSPTATPGPYTVYITGAVEQPETVVTLDYGSRVLDALAAAGGPLANADLEHVNLAQRLDDGDQVHVPTREGIAASNNTPQVLVITATPGHYTVYVVGAITQPESMVSLPAGSRVEDALTAAGGVTSDADLSQINLSQRLNDGDYIYVPAMGETAIITPTPNHPALVHINSATVDELDTLPGIGPALAQTIVDYRTENGPFLALEDLDNVPGIGPAKLEAIRELIVFD